MRISDIRFFFTLFLRFFLPFFHTEHRIRLRAEEMIFNGLTCPRPHIRLAASSEAACLLSIHYNKVTLWMTRS